MATDPFPKDIYTEPAVQDVNTLANLGPLRAMAGVWRGVRGLDAARRDDRPDRSGDRRVDEIGRAHV